MQAVSRTTQRLRTLTTSLRMVAAFLTSACSAEAPRQDPFIIPAVHDVERVGRFTDRLLAEASGIVPAVRVADVFWSHNDSGNDPLLFAHDRTGKALGHVRVVNAANRDWEAMAGGPCPVGTCVYIGDVGDNAEAEPLVRVYRVPEPLPIDSVTAPAEAVRIRYPDGPHDVEALWVGPDTSLYLVTKRPARTREGRLRPARVYRVAPAAWRSPAVAVAMLIDSLPVTPAPAAVWSWITDAALSQPDSVGHRALAIRSYTQVLVFATDSVTGRPTTLRGHCALEAFKTGLDGEGVAWLPDGRLLFTNEGRHAPLDVARCP